MRMINELLDEGRVNYINPALSTKTDKRYEVRIHFVIRHHHWWGTTKVSANNEKDAKEIAYKVLKEDLKMAANMGVRYVESDANLISKKKVNATPSRVNKS